MRNLEMVNSAPMAGMNKTFFLQRKFRVRMAFQNGPKSQIYPIKWSGVTFHRAFPKTSAPDFIHEKSNFWGVCPHYHLGLYNTNEFRDLSSRVASTKQQLDDIQSALGSNPSDTANQASKKVLCKQYLTLARAEESFARQKSRIQWLKLGDQCTSFFFKSISNSRNRNRITSLVLEDGTVTQNIEQVKSSFINYYSKLLGSPHQSSYDGTSRVQQLITRKFSESQKLDMVLEVSDKEVKDNVWSLTPQKAPGPNGYNATFFHKAWPVIGHEVNSAVKSFIRFGQLLKKANATLVAFILAHRIKSALSHLIDPAQSGFVQRKRIADNIFLTQQLMRRYHKQSPTPRCAMKVDIMKAYDNVRWEFLWDILASMNFHPQMIRWIKAYITTTNYSLSFNGGAIGYIPGQKGLRKDNPLSSYSFVIVMEVLTCILKEKSLLPDFNFHWNADPPNL
ncbi:uncharacterized protein LOC131302974 [Rhododendron vialii]|uniref:uncharacterized protein LOC131302974 n=1 Tax=Rhododendron vialii TaxID=182163 RepID=UPI002660246F|nr:uncharacterized protein LOC131302974 [Rhododendron vialii]